MRSYSPIFCTGCIKFPRSRYTPPPPFAILHSPDSGLIAALWPPHAARFNLSFLNRSCSARCNSSPIRCTFAATIDSPTVRSKPSLLRDLTRSSPCFSKFRIPASTAAWARLAATNSSSLSCSFAAFDKGCQRT